MSNVSYDQTKQIRSAAGTARTTPGISGTTRTPSQFQNQNQYGVNPAYGRTPSTPPPAAGTTPHLSKAAGGTGSGNPQRRPRESNKPAWLVNSQKRFQDRVGQQNNAATQQLQNQTQKQEFQSGQNLGYLRKQIEMAASNPNYTPSAPPQPAATTQPLGAPSMYQYQNAGQLQVPSMQQQVNQIPQLSQMNMMMQNPEYQNAFQQWLQQQYGQGLLNGRT